MGQLRLACLGANRLKNKFDDVLDPFAITHGTFELSLFTGQIRPGSNLSTDMQANAKQTITRLKLDSDICCEMRRKHFVRYLRAKDEESLRELSPFVWYEANRQGLL